MGLHFLVSCIPGFYSKDRTHWSPVFVWSGSDINLCIRLEDQPERLLVLHRI